VVWRRTRCPKCYVLLRRGDTFCPSCGARVLWRADDSFQLHVTGVADEVESVTRRLVEGLASSRLLGDKTAAHHSDVQARWTRLDAWIQGGKMSSDFPSPDELRRAYEESRMASRPQRRTFSEWRQDRAEYRERLRRLREQSAREARETARERQRLALAQVDARAESLRSAARSRRYEHRTSMELASYVANVYRARGYTARIQPPMTTATTTWGKTVGSRTTFPISLKPI
jgi:uncharacterized Zn finger protein (UPF0148 family)